MNMKLGLALIHSMTLSITMAQLNPIEIDYERFVEETQVNNGTESELYFVW
jgi:hypothetical protein